MRAAQLLVALLYSFWEHEYRPRLAASLGLADADELKIPLFGDIRALRRDVIHHHGVVTKETAAKLSVLAGFHEGKEITLTEGDVEALIRSIKAAMDVMKILPPLIIGEKEVDMFVNALDDVLSECRKFPGPMWELGNNFVRAALGSRKSTEPRPVSATK